MKLTVSTPLSVVVEVENATHLRAEDETGAFGMLPGHADFLTVLAVSVITWRDDQGTEHHIAVDGGMLQMRDGEAITVATRAAVPGDDLRQLETDVIARFRRQESEEQTAHKDAQLLYLAAIRQICHLLRPTGRIGTWGLPAADRFEEFTE